MSLDRIAANLRPGYLIAGEKLDGFIGKVVNLYTMWEEMATLTRC